MTIRLPESEYNDVRQLDLFSEMEEANFNDLMRAAYVQNFPPMVELFSEGDPADFLHILLSGSVEEYSNWDGRITTMAVVRPVSTFIIAATIKDAPHLLSSRTLEKSRIALIPSKDVRAIFDVDPKFARGIVSELAQCYRSVIKNTKDLKLRTSLERLANYLLRAQAYEGGARSLELRLEKRRLASFLGMTPENLSRAFKALQPHGVMVTGNTVFIDDDAALRKFAKPTPFIDDYSFGRPCFDRIARLQSNTRIPGVP